MQSGLFEDIAASTEPERLDLGDGCLSLFAQAFDRSSADALLDSLLQGIAWRQDSLWIGGREVAVPRLQCWMGDRGSVYGYSGMRLEPSPWQAPVRQIKARVEALCQTQFNSVLLNLYRHGQDSVSWHADDEAELGPAPLIASCSFGAEREFQLKPRQRKNLATRRLTLPHGSLLLMEKGIQNKWLHQIPKVRGLTEPRINLTFRNILTPAPAD